VVSRSAKACCRHRVKFFIIIERKRRKVEMKKIICLLAVVLMVASVAFAAAKITAKDVAGLKGTWTGSLDFGMVGASSGSSPCTLEILNDKVPVDAKLTLSNVPDFVANAIGTPAGKNEFNMTGGQLTSQGTIYWTGPEKNSFEVSMGGEKKLNASYWFRSIRGSAILKKK